MEDWSWVLLMVVAMLLYVFCEGEPSLRDALIAYLMRNAG